MEAALKLESGKSFQRPYLFSHGASVMFILLSGGAVREATYEKYTVTCISCQFNLCANSVFA